MRATATALLTMAVALVLARTTAASPPLFLLKYSEDTVDDELTLPQRLSPVGIDVENIAFHGPVRLMIAASLGSLSTTATTEIASDVTLAKCNGMTSMLFMVDATVADVERVLQSLWLTLTPPPSLLGARCGDRAFRPPRVDMWLQEVDSRSPQITCADLPNVGDHLESTGVHHHLKSITVRSSPASIQTSTDTLRVRGAEEVLLAGLTLHVPDEATVCDNLNQRQRFRLRVFTASKMGGGQVMLRTSVTRFLSAYMTNTPASPDARKLSRVIQLEATSDYIRLALRSLKYTAHSDDLKDEIHIDLWTIGAAGDERSQSVRLVVTVMREAVPAQVLWDRVPINASKVVDMNEDLPLLLSGLSIQLPSADHFQNLVLNVTLAATHGLFNVPDDGSLHSVTGIIMRQEIDASAIQMSGTTLHLNGFVQRLTFNPTPNYNGPDSIVISIVQNVSGEDPMAIIQPTSELLHLFFHPVEDGFSIEWTDSRSKINSVTISSFTRRRLPLLSILDGEEYGDDIPFFTYQRVLRAVVEVPVPSGVDLHHDGVQVIHISRNGSDFVQLTFEGTVSGLKALLSGVELLPKRSGLVHRADASVVVRVVRVDGAGGSISPAIEARLNVTTKRGGGSYLPQIFLQHQIEVHEGEPIDLGNVFAWETFVSREDTDVVGVVVWIAVNHGHVAPIASFETTVPQANLTIQAESSEDLKNQLSRLTYFPQRHFAGDDKLTLSVDNATATLWIRVLPVNGPPSLVVGDQANSTELTSLRTFVPPIKVDDPDTDDWLTLELTVEANCSLALKDPTEASTSGLQILGIGPESWAAGPPFITDKLRARGTSTTINHVFSGSSVVEILAPDGYQKKVQAVDLRICVFDEASLGDCVTRSVQLPSADSLVRFVAEIPPLAFGRPMPISAFAVVNAAALSSEEPVSIHLISQWGSFVTTNPAIDAPRYGQSTERRYDSEGTTKVVRELTGSWGYVCDLLQRSEYRGASIASAAPTIDTVSIELWQSTRRLVTRSFTLQLRPPMPRFHLSVTDSSSRAREPTGNTSTEPSVWRWERGKSAVLHQFVEITIISAIAEETMIDENEIDVEDRLLALNVSCSASCVLSYNLQDNGGVVPRVDYSFAAKQPSDLLNFFGTRQSLSQLLLTLEIEAAVVSAVIGDGYVDVSLAEVENSPYETAVSSARATFHFETTEPPLEWQVAQSMFTSAAASDVVSVDGVSLTGSGHDSFRHVGVVIECEGVIALSVTINHPAVRLADHPCGLIVDHSSIEIANSLVMVNDILAKVQVQRRDLQDPLHDVQESTLRFVLARNGNEDDNLSLMTEVQVQFRPALTAQSTLTQRVVAASNTTRVVDEDSSVPLGNVLALQDIVHDDTHLYHLSAAVSHGVLSMTLDEVCCIHLISSASARTLVVEGTLPALRDALAVVRYLPFAEYSGIDALRIVVKDEKLDMPKWMSALAIQVRPVNDAPHIVTHQAGSDVVSYSQNGSHGAFLQTEVSIQVTDADLAILEASRSDSSRDSHSDPSIVRVRLHVPSSTAFILVPRWRILGDSLKTPSYVPAQFDPQNVPQDIPMQTVTFDAPMDTANALLSSVLFASLTGADRNGEDKEIDDSDEDVLEMYVSDLGHGMSAWEAAETTQRINIRRGMDQADQNTIVLTLPPHHASLDSTDRRLTISGLSLTTTSTVNDDHFNLDQLHDGDHVRVTGKAAFRVVPEVQRIRLVGPEQVQTLTVVLQTSGGIDAASVGGTFDLQIMVPITDQVKTVAVHAQAVAMRFDEVMGNEGTGRGLGESMEASFASILPTANSAKIQVVKSVAVSEVTWSIYSVVTRAKSMLPVPQVVATAFSGLGVGTLGDVTVLIKTEVQAASLGGYFVLRLGDEITRSIDAEATTLDVQDAIEELASINVVQVSSVDAYAWDVTFFQPGSNVPRLEGDAVGLTPVAKVSDTAWPTLISSSGAVQITRITEGFGQGSVYEVDINGTHVDPVYSVTVRRDVVSTSGGTFALSFRSDATSAVLAMTDSIAFDAVATTTDEAVLPQEGGRLGSSMESKLRTAIQRLPQHYWSTATRVIVSGVTTVSPPASTWTITFVDASSDFPSLIAATSASQPPAAHLTVVVSLLTPSNAIGGTFTLSYQEEETTPLPILSSAVIVQDRLNALHTVRNTYATFGRVLVRRREIRSVGGASFAVLFVEQMSATSLLIADGGGLTGLGAFARVRPFRDSVWKDGSWAFPSFTSLPTYGSATAWASGMEGSFEPSQFALRGAAADVRVWLQQFSYTQPSDWCCGFTSVVVQAERAVSPSDKVTIKTDEQSLRFHVSTGSVLVDALDGNGDSNDVAVVRGQLLDVNFFRIVFPSWARGLLWLRVRVRATYGTLALKNRVDMAASTELWLNGTAETINRLLGHLQYALVGSSNHGMDVLAVKVLSHLDNKLITQSEHLIRVKEPPFEPRVSLSAGDVALVASDDAPLAVTGVAIIDANAALGMSSETASAVVVLGLHLEAKLGRVFLKRADGLLSNSPGENSTAVTLRGSVSALNDALASLHYESSREFTHTRDTITIRTNFHPDQRPLLTNSRSMKVEIHHAIHTPRVRIAFSDAVAYAAKEDNGYRFPNLTIGATASRPLTPRPAQLRRAVVTELRRTELQPSQVTTLKNVSSENDPRHRWVVDLPGLSSSAASSRSFASIPLSSGVRFVFTGTDRTSGEELWASDGSTNGTQLLVDLAPGKASASPSDFAVLPPANNRVVFAADGIDCSWSLDTATTCNRERTSSTAPDLLYVVAASATWNPSASYDCPRYGWRWATTVEASTRFPDSNSGPSARVNLSEPYVFWDSCDWTGYLFGGITRKYFRFADSAGTGALKHAGRRDSAPVEVSFSTANFAGIVCIRDKEAIKDSAAGRELWITDGSAAVGSTKRLHDIDAGPRSSNPKFLTPFQSRWILFQATTAVLGAELFKTDGTTSGTVLVEDIWRGPRSSSPSDFAEWSGGDGRLYFAATTEAGRELWSTDGLSSLTVARGSVLIGTTMVRDICASPTQVSSSNPQFLTPLGALGVFFSATDGVNGRELWVTDGTLAGTKMVKDVNPTAGQGSDPSHLVAFNGKLYFAATVNVESMGRELFVSDGTTAGTQLLLELVPGAPSAAPSLLTVANARLYFHALDAQGVGSLWVSDGTAPGTTQVWDAPFAQSHTLQPQSTATSVPTTSSGRNDKLFVLNSALYYFTQRKQIVAYQESDSDDKDDTFQLQITVDHGTISIPPERAVPLPSQIVNGTRRRLEDVLRRMLYQPPLNWNVLQSPQALVVQWNFSVSALTLPSLSTEITVADLIVRPQIDPPVIIVPTGVQHATRSERDYLSRLQLECLPITVLEDVATPLRGFSIRGVDDLDGEATWDLELLISRGRADFPMEAAGCVRIVTQGQLSHTKHVRLTTTRVACLSHLLSGLTYTSDPHTSGSDTLTIRVRVSVGLPVTSTAGNEVVVPIVITEVNDAPYLTSQSGFFYEADEDSALMMQDLRVEDPDSTLNQLVRVDIRVRYGSIALLYHEANSVRSSIVVQQNESAVWAPGSSTRLVVLGSLQDVNAALASVAYTSARHWNSLAHANENDGYDSISFELSDNHTFNASTHANLYVFVMPTPDPVAITPPTVIPTSVYAARDDGSTLHGDEDAWLDMTGLAFTSEDDTSRASLDVTLRVSHGRLAMDETVLRSNGVSTSGSMNDGSLWRLRGRFALVNHSVASLRYLPARDFYGADALEIVATATDDYAHQQSIQTTRVVAIQVHAVNDPPQWTLPAFRVAWKQDGPTRITDVVLHDADVATVDCTTLVEGCTYEVVLEVTGSGSLTLPRMNEVTAFSTASAASRATNYVVLTGSLPTLNRALSEIVLTTSDSESLVREPTEVWFTADDRGTFGSGGPHVARQHLVVAPFQWTHHPLTLVAPQAEVLTMDEDTKLVFHGSIRLHDRDASTRSMATSPQYEVTMESHHGQFRLATSAFSSTRLLVLPASSSPSDRVLRFRGFMPQINAALNGSAYVPDRDWFGADHISLTAKELDDATNDAYAATATLFVFVAPVCDAPRWQSPRDGANASDLQADVVLDEDSQVLVTSLAIVDPDTLDNEQENDIDSHRELSIAIDVHDGGGIMLATTRGLRIRDERAPTAWPSAFASLRLLFFSHVVIIGRVGDLNAALHSLVYRPQPEFHTNGHVRDAITLQTFTSNATCSVGDSSTAVRTLRAQIFAVNDPPRIDSPQFHQVFKRDRAGLDSVLTPTLEAVVGEEQPLAPITLVDVDVSTADDLVVFAEPTVQVRVSCRACIAIPAMKLETLQQTHGVVVTQDVHDEVVDTDVWGPTTTYYGSISTLNAVVLSSLRFMSSPHVFNGSAVVLLEVSDLSFFGRGGPSETMFAMAVRVLRVNIGPQILVPLYGTRAPPLEVDESGSVLLQGAPPLPSLMRGTRSPRDREPTWQLLFVDPRGGDPRSRLQSLLDVASQDGYSAISSYTLLSSTQLVFSAFNTASGTELWTTDGTANGTQLRKDLRPGTHGSDPRYLTRFSVDNRVYFSARASNSDDWRLQREGRDKCDGFRESAFATGVFFAVARQTTWNVDERYDCPDDFQWMTTAEAAIVFVGTVPHDGHATEPLVYFDQCGWDGFDWGGQSRRHFRFADSATTGAFKDAGFRESYRPDVGFQTQQFAGIVCRRLSHDESDAGNDKILRDFLWSTDGTSENTRRVTSVASRPAFLTEFRGQLFFQATTAAYGAELWASDGSSSGTRLIADVAEGTRSSSPEQLTVANEKLFFSATSDAYGRELWMSDGDPRTEFAQVEKGASGATATRLVLDIASGGASSHPQFLTALPTAGLLLFQANDGVHGSEIWKSDGSAGGTALVLDIHSGSHGSQPRFLTLFSDRIFFQADDGVHGAELWTTDGSSAGTQLLVDLVAGARGSVPRYLSLLTLPSVANGLSVLVFAAATDRDPQVVEFWTSDGSSSGTQKLFAASREPATLNDAAMGALHDGRRRLLPIAGGFVVLGQRRQQQQRPSETNIMPVVVSRSLTLVDDDNDGDGHRTYSVMMRTERGGLLSLPNRHACGGGEDVPSNTMELYGSLLQLNCYVTQVVYETTSLGRDVSTTMDGWDDAIVVTLTEDSEANDREDGRLYATTQRVAVHVAALNHAPVVTMPTRIVVPLDAWAMLSTIRVSDADAGESAMLLLRVAVQRGRVRLVDVDAIPYGLVLLSVVDPRGRAALEVSGSVTALNTLLLQSVQYACWQADGCVDGDRDVVVVTVDDNGFSGRGGALSSTQTAPIAVVGGQS